MSMAKHLKIGQYVIKIGPTGLNGHQIKRLHEVCAVRLTPHVHIVAQGVPEECVGFNTYVPSAPSWHDVQRQQDEEIQKKANSRAEKKRLRAAKVKETAKPRPRADRSIATA